jgi:hypothetical protein
MQTIDRKGIFFFISKKLLEVHISGPTIISTTNFSFSTLANIKNLNNYKCSHIFQYLSRHRPTLGKKWLCSYGLTQVINSAIHMQAQYLQPAQPLQQTHMAKQFGQASRTTQLVPSGLYNLVAGHYGQYPQGGPNYIGAGLELQQGRPGECGGPMGMIRPQATGSKPVSAAPVGHFVASALAQAHNPAAGGPLPMQETNLGAQGHLNT